MPLYRTCLAYRFPPLPGHPHGFIEGFAAQDVADSPAQSRATAIATAKLQRKLDFLAKFHGVPLPLEKGRLLISRGDRGKISAAELEVLRRDWKVSYAAPDNGMI